MDHTQFSDKYTTITPAAEEPVTLVEAKAWLNVSHSNDDTKITSLIEAARQQAERSMGRTIVSTIFDLYFDQFSGFMGIKKGGITEITSIKYQDSDDSEQTLATSNYETSRDFAPDSLNFTRIKILTGPTVLVDGYDNVIIRLVAGWANKEAVPEIIKTAIKTRVGTFYETRQEIYTGTQVNEIPNWFDSMLNDYKIINL